MLINLNNYLPFNIDAEMLERLSFSETLLISYIPSRASETNMKKTKVKVETPVEEPPVCGCTVCMCKVLPSHSGKKSKYTPNVNAPSTSTGNDSFRSDNYSSSSTYTSYSDEVSEKSIEFNDSFFQQPMSETSDEAYSYTVEDTTECLQTPIENLENSVPTGARTISVKRVGLIQDKLSVYVHSRFYQDGYEVGLTLSSKVDSRLHTLDESSMEHMKKNEKEFVEREISLILTPDNYHCEFSCRKGEDKSSSTKSLTLDQIEDVMMDGAFVVFFRYMAITKFEGQFNMKQVNISGEICDAEIMSKIYENEMVYNVRMPVMKICKKKTSPSGQVKIKGYIMTLSGQLLQMHSSYSKYVIHINPLQVAEGITQSIKVMSPELRTHWKKIINMFSIFVDPNYEEMFDVDELTQKAQLQLLLTEYYDMILMMKPLDVLPFTLSYFFNIFTADNIPHNPYFDKTFRRVRYMNDF